MLFWGLLDRSLDQVVEFYAVRAEAEKVLERILADEPSWREMLDVVPVSFGEFCAN